MTGYFPEGSSIELADQNGIVRFLNMVIVIECEGGSLSGKHSVSDQQTIQRYYIFSPSALQILIWQTSLTS